ncbi:carboxypeptidase regulatory-like domain-containing protein [Neorhodopirellula pilleata]|uniref:Carboxypeptidase regulatory-like domain-containing protein n=1 Tax=Neorhodopirellula pilleata TaxID=2714738 RepID=A0A5C6A295_9BACT|nr:carboxypeptidase regulatory-like domain-containing protein [Neorhodopirellula pilleata]TWT93536.1 hypothetical protein Pla100_40540 [Neorhodopirellula pilleata]
MIRNTLRAISFGAGIVLVVSLGGCSNVVGPTSGTVRFVDGTPVMSGSIEFRRTSDKARFASRISSEGTFHPADQDGNVGLPSGAYEVVVVQIVLTEDLAKEAHAHGNTVPRRYADYYTSGLTVEIADDRTDPVMIVLEP